MLSEKEILEALSTVRDPEIGKPITELEMVRSVTVEGPKVRVEVLLTVAGCPLKERIEREVTAALIGLDGVREVEVVLGVMSEAQRQALVGRLRVGQPQQGEQPVAFWHDEGKSTRAILVASGKGGVGKSSITANLAVALAQQGFKVGVVDCDVYGASQPRMLGAEGRPVILPEGVAMPLEVHGVKVMSMGSLVPDDQPVIYRGPMVHKWVYQFLAHTYWGDVDFVIVDMPPGTGDVSITLSQMLPGADMLVVTTPQEAAERVAARAGKMTEQVNLNVLGVIENMSYFACPTCGDQHRIFGEGGGRTLAERLGAPFLGEVPIDIRLREGADEGKPIVLTDPDSPGARAILEIAKEIGKTAPSLRGKRLPIAMGQAAGGGHRH